MTDLIVSLAIGIVLIIFGIINTKGNVNMLHKYHTKRVAPENIKPFGKLVGIGSIISGTGIAINSIFCFVSQSTCNHTIETVGTAILIASLVVGIGMILFAMIKYNKGIF